LKNQTIFFRSELVILLVLYGFSLHIALGKLGGYLRLDSQIIPGHLAELNDLAQEFATQVNAVHATGQGLDGSTGLDFFTFTPGDEARTLAVALTDGEAVAAAQLGGSAGDGTVAQQITDLRDLPVPGLGDQTFVSRFSQMVFAAGLEVRRGGGRIAGPGGASCRRSSATAVTTSSPSKTVQSSVCCRWPK